jgi:hypothetical protein
MGLSIDVKNVEMLDVVGAEQGNAQTKVLLEGSV